MPRRARLAVVLLLSFFAASRAHAQERVVRAMRVGSSAFGGSTSLGVELGDRLVFFGAADSGPADLWISDGTSTGTTLVKTMRTDAAQGLVVQTALRRVGGAVIFAADDGVHDVELWRTDGTPAGTALLVDPNTAGSSQPSDVFVMGAAGFFRAAESSGAFALFRTDGTPAGTSKIKAVAPYHFASAGTTLFFAGSDAQGFEPWRSDGTPTGTQIVTDIAAGAGSSIPLGNGGAFGGVGANKAVFVVDEGPPAGTTLWVTDGTAGGTAPIADPRPGLQSPFGTVPRFVSAGAFAFFAANDGATGYELWRTDGTTAGTFALADLAPGAASSVGPIAQEMVAVGSRLFFVADDTRGPKLYVSDGSTAGTVLVKDVGAGSGKAVIRDLIAVGDTLYFVGGTGASGTARVWRSDGTPAGTAPLPGQDAVVRGDLTKAGRFLYYAGVQSAVTPTLYAYELEPARDGGASSSSSSASSGGASSTSGGASSPSSGAPAGSGDAAGDDGCGCGLVGSAAAGPAGLVGVVALMLARIARRRRSG